MLSVQNAHLGKAENNETEIVHAARRGGRRSPRRSNAGRWALGAGAATAGIAIMARTKTGRKLTAKVRRSKALKGVRKAVLTQVRKARGTATGLGIRRFVQARKVGARKIVASARGAAGRVYEGAKNSRVGTAFRSGYGRVSALGSRLKAAVGGGRRYAAGARKRAAISSRRLTRGPVGRGRATSRGSGGRRRITKGRTR